MVAVAGGIYAARSAAAPPYGPAGEIFFILALFLKENHKNTVQIWPARECIFVNIAAVILVAHAFPPMVQIPKKTR